MFGNDVATTLVEQRTESEKTLQGGPNEQELTAFFASIDSYVALAEKVPLGLLPELMQSYLTACTDLLQREGGTLDKYVGDTVVAMFGAPSHLPDHALRSCVAALKIQTEIADLREKFRREEHKWPSITQGLRVRIGLNTGMALVGNMGSRNRFNYSMMGDEVNLAARMESGAKSWGVWTLCSNSTRDACEQAQQGRVLFRPLGPIIVKGRPHPLNLFEPIALREAVTNQVKECVSLFEAGLARYLAQDWDGAEALFRRSAMLEPHQPGKSPGVVQNPSLVFLSLCANLRASPPPPEWSGVYIVRQK